MDTTRIHRLLLVEDDPARYEFFKRHTAPEFRIVWARSGGTALAILKRDAPDDYAGILLDHDLGDQGRGDGFATGQVVARAVAQKIDNSVPVLVHSTNDKGATHMVSTLRGADFDVTRVAFYDLSVERYLAWLTGVFKETVD